MRIFKYKLGQDVIMKPTGKIYSIIARTEYITAENKYWLADSGGQSNFWAVESDLMPVKEEANP